MRIYELRTVVRAVLDVAIALLAVLVAWLVLGN